MTDSKQRSATRTPSALAHVWEQRTQLVKQEMAAASAASDAKTLRLRALRLEKERQDAEVAASQPEETSAKAKPRVKRVVVS
jgi:hypothetical protein